ncbi:hypothetical protein ACFSTC_60680 [Nonomuraea ferruginea]
MQTSKTIKDQQRAYAQRLLAALGKHLSARDVTAVLIITADGRPALDVTDRRGRMRRVFVHLSFCWFYWGDQNDERVSFLQMARRGGADRAGCPRRLARRRAGRAQHQSGPDPRCPPRLRRWPSADG